MLVFRTCGDKKAIDLHKVKALSIVHRTFSNGKKHGASSSSETISSGEILCIVLNVHVVVDLYPSESLDPRRRLCSGMETGPLSLYRHSFFSLSPTSEGQRVREKDKGASFFGPDMPERERGRENRGLT